MTPPPKPTASWLEPVVLESAQPVSDERADRLPAFEASESSIGQVPNRIYSVQIQHGVEVLAAPLRKHIAR
jgi:hypothetical protein